MTGDRVLAYRRRCLASGDSLSTVERGTRLLTFLAERWNLNLADGHPTHDNKTLNCPSLLNGKPVSDTPPGSPKAPNDTPCGPVRVRRRGRR